MKEYSTIQERNLFIECINELVEEYLEDADIYTNETNADDGMGLSVNLKTLELQLNNRSANPAGWDFYLMEQLIRSGDYNTEAEPDTDAIFDLASSYCFIR